MTVVPINAGRAPADPRPMPASADAEQAFLGALLVQNDVLAHVAGFLSADDFSAEINRRVFTIAAEMIGSGRLASPITVRPFLGDHDLGGGTTWPAYLARLAAEAGPPIAARDYAMTIRDLAVRRSMIAAARDLEAQAYDAPVDMRPAEIASGALDRLAVLGEDPTQTKRVAAGASAARLVAKAQEIMSGAEVASGVSTGFSDLDDATGGYRPGALWIVAGRPGMGKAQPLDALIRLPNGWTTFRDIREGDEIAAAGGGTQRVVRVSPQGWKKVYRVTLSDGRSTEACEDHLWSVRYREWDAPRVKTTRQLISMLERQRYRGRLMVCQSSGEYGEELGLPLDPYLLGAILGDGSVTQDRVGFSCAEPHTLSAVVAVLPPGMRASRVEKYGYNLRSTALGVANPIKRAFVLMGIWGSGSPEKRIPYIYLTASRRQRLRLLQGLMDTDGYADKAGCVQFDSTSSELARGVQELARSLGYWVSIVGRPNFLMERGVKTRKRDCYTVIMTGRGVDEVFTVPKKKDRCQNRKFFKSLTVTSIEETKEAECACIAVSDPSRLYITNDYVVTHNSVVGGSSATKVAGKGHGVLVFSLELAEEEFAARLLADLSYSALRPIAFSQIMRGALDDEELWTVSDAQRRLERMPLVVDYSSRLSAAEIKARIHVEGKRLRAQGKRLGVVFVDYLKFVAASDRYKGNRVYEVGEISAALKAAAKDEGVCIVLLAQLNRALESREDKRPGLSDLRESGDLEADADVVAFIHREHYYLEKSPKGRNPDDDTIKRLEESRNQADLILGKNRSGPCKTIPLFCVVGCSTMATRSHYGEAIF